MASIIECDIIQSEDGEVVQMGAAKTVTVTWTPATPVTTQAVTIYQIGRLVFLNTAGWFAGTAAGASAFVSTALPQVYWPAVDRHVPIEILNNAASYITGDLLISATDGKMTIGLMNGPGTPSAFAGAACAWNLKGSYIL